MFVKADTFEAMYAHVIDARTGEEIMDCIWADDDEGACERLAQPIRMRGDGQGPLTEVLIRPIRIEFRPAS